MSARAQPEVFIRDAVLVSEVEDGLRCGVCARGCVMAAGDEGWCRTRESRGGRMLALSYGAVSSACDDPIEKKPLFHFLPGSRVMTYGGWSCNFACPWCQNWEISKTRPPVDGSFVAPREAVDLAAGRNCASLALSYNEPTMMIEWALDVFRLAVPAGIRCCFVTNGYMTREALTMLRDAGLSAMNVDVKGSQTCVRAVCSADVEAVHATCREALRLGIHLELTTLVIPGFNDDPVELRALCGRVVEELGCDVPWHFTAYHPSYSYDVPATPPRVLDECRAMAREAGMRHVYTGNSGLEHADTLCPACGTTLIERRGFSVRHNRIATGRCPDCGESIYGVWAAAG